MLFKSRRSASGFTLMEVLIALVIIALVGVVLAQTSSQSVDQTDYLKRKLLATWAAENHMAILRLQDSSSFQGAQTGATQTDQPILLEEQESEQGVWTFRTVPRLEKQASGVWRVVIDVYQPVKATSPLYTLSSYLPAPVTDNGAAN